MTTVVYADSVLAYDGRVTNGNIIICDDVDKLEEINGVSFIFIGPICDFNELANVYLGTVEITDDIKKNNEARAIIFNKTVIESVYIHNQYGLVRAPVGTYPEAWGSGSDFAIAGLKMGMNAVEAVELAIKCDVDTGGKVRSFNIN